MNFSERNTPSTSDLNPSGGTSQTNEMNCRSSAGTSGYNCGADTSSSDWSIGSIGKTRRLYMSETPLPGVTRTLQANFPSGTDYWCAEILLCRCIVTFKIQDCFDIIMVFSHNSIKHQLFVVGSSSFKTPVNMKRKGTSSSSKGMTSFFMGSSSGKSMQVILPILQ